ncbi:AbrB/MazE/SpoVT family DNA-binding domain-containing protein [Candidatus Woesearchaeota archaeon]|nr:AbrB/MazE/SpoVT family DNA-binding domain-containing protein [Candidatus Woesearchaeota archaeon]
MKFHKKLFKIGNSLGVIVPKLVIDEYDFKEGDTIKIKIEKAIK